jgi:hypothetical protein
MLFENRPQKYFRKLLSRCCIMTWLYVNPLSKAVHKHDNRVVPCGGYRQVGDEVNAN